MKSKMFKNDEKGYALMEAMLSILILSIGLMAVLKIFLYTSQIVKHEIYFQEPARSLAESLLKRYQLGLLKSDRSDPYSEQPFSWIISKSPWPNSSGLEKVSVTVHWRENEKSGSVIVTTLFPVKNRRTLSNLGFSEGGMR